MTNQEIETVAKSLIELVRKAKDKSELLIAAMAGENFYNTDWDINIFDGGNWRSVLQKRIEYLKTVEGFEINESNDLLSFKQDILDALSSLSVSLRN